MPDLSAAVPDLARGTPARPAGGAELALEGVSKVYGALVALSSTDLAIRPGEFFSMIGPSGSGKSTLLGMVAGFVPPSAGRILVDGQDVVALPPFRRNIGMVFQNYALFPHMTVAANIAFPLRMRRWPKAQIEARVRRMLEVVRLPGLGNRAIAQLSGGQQQRVALARAASYDPKLLLMDEPLGALDKNLREEMQYEIKRFHAEIGATILYVTHDQDEAASMSDRIAILNHGAVVQVGAPRALYERPGSTFVAGFLGEANLFAVRSVAATPSGRLCVQTVEGWTFIAAAAEQRGGAATMCVRPEAIRISDGAAPAENALQAVLVDVVYTAGTLRVRADIGQGRVITARRPLRRQTSELACGTTVRLSWNAEDTILIPESQNSGESQ